MNKQVKKELMVKRLEKIKNIYYLTIGLLTWLSIIEFAGLMAFILRGDYYDLLTGLIFTSIFASLFGGSLAIYFKIPPFHNFVLVGAFIDLVYSITLIAITKTPTGIFHPILAFLILYLGMRYPLSLDKTVLSFQSK